MSILSSLLDGSTTLSKVIRPQQAKQHLRRVEELPELAWMMRSSKSRRAFSLMLEARKLSGQDKLHDAKKIYHQAIELDSTYYRLHSFLAMIYHRLGDYENAQNYWGKALSLRPNDVGSNLGLAETLAATGKLMEGIQKIDDLQQLFPKRGEILARRALFTERAQNLLLSAEYWRQAHGLETENPEFALGLARVLIKLGNRIEGKKILQNVKTLKPDHLPTQIEVGNGLLNLNFPSEAVKHFQSLARSHEQSVPVLNGLIRSVDSARPISEVLNWWKEFLEWDTLSKTYQSHTEQRPPPQMPTERKTRLLIVSYQNWNFMQEIVEGLAANEQFEVRTLEFGREIVTALEYLKANPAENSERLNQHKNNFPLDVELLEWADVVFCEWCVHGMVWLTRHLPSQTKLICRLHSFEAYGPWPLMVDWSRVDHLTFVADHIREYLDDSLNLSRFKNLTLSTVTPAHPVENFILEKNKDAAKTLGMMGYNNSNKNPLLALRILKQLTEADTEWKLRLVGHDWSGKVLTESEEKYRNEFYQFIEDHQLETHVIFDNWTYDVQDWLQKVGFMISASTREGTHEAIAQGMSSGAIPVVRKWPLSLRWKGAERRYPTALLFETPDEATQKILQISNEGSLSEKSKQFTEEAKQRFTPQVVVSQISEMIRE